MFESRETRMWATLPYRAVTCQARVATAYIT